MNDTSATGSATGKFSCRKLETSDLEKVMHWRMLPHVTEFMNTDPALTLEGQEQWYQKLVDAGELYHWIIEVDGFPCGLIYLTDMDPVNKRCSWGYYIAEKKLRSVKLAIALEMSLYDYVFSKLGLNKIYGESFRINSAIAKLHELCGCKTEGVLRQHIFKNGRYYDLCLQSILAEEWANLRNKIKYQHIDFSN